jgi:hypothetical protein
MAHENVTVVLGLPVPSSDRVFLAVVVVHVAFALAAVGTGAAAMLSAKARGNHSRFGAFYFWSLAGVFVTMAALASMRWAEDYRLFVVGSLSFGSAYFGRSAARRHPHKWPRLHLAGMGASYILMLTGFYVDNGPNLPGWKELPPLAFWFLPGLIGVPLIFYVWKRHPLTRSAGQGAPDKA